jgi:micrococcal nuclease
MIGKLNLTSRHFLRTAMLVITVLAFWGGSQFLNSAKPAGQDTVVAKEEGEVVYVTDGDTIKVMRDGAKETVRLIGVDTPETKDPRKPVQCFGREASKKTTDLLLGKHVRLEYDPVAGDKDKYGRLLRYVFLDDGTNISRQLIFDGYAHEYTYGAQLYKYRDDFMAAEKDARENKRGLWADDACSGFADPVN